MIERYGEAEMRASRQVLFDFWLARPEVVAHLEGGAIAPRAYAAFLTTAFDTDPKAPELYGSIYGLTSFFDQAYFCFDSDVCDPAMVRRYFCPIAGNLDRLYGPVFAAVRTRSGYDAYATGIAGFAAACA